MQAAPQNNHHNTAAACEVHDCKGRDEALAQVAQGMKAKLRVRLRLARWNRVHAPGNALTGHTEQEAAEHDGKDTSDAGERHRIRKREDANAHQDVEQ